MILHYLFVFVFFFIIYLSWISYEHSPNEECSGVTLICDAETYDNAINILNKLGYAKRDVKQIIYDMPPHFTAEQMVQEFFTLTNANDGV